MKETDKIATFIGFAQKARGCVTGSESVKKNKKILVLFLSRDAGPNTAKDILAKARHEKIPIIVPQHADLADLVHKEKCKTAGITHKELAKGILDSLQNNENYKLLQTQDTGGF